MAVCLIGLGSNLGDRSRLLDEALVRLQRHPDIEVLRQSGYHETRPAGGPDAQPAFLNAVAVLQTAISPQALLAELQKVEAGLGRGAPGTPGRSEHWGPRTIDLDLLLYDDLTWTEPDLVIPHSRMAWRRFVLEPAAEVAPEMLHPGTGWTIARLLEHLNQTPWYLAIAGPIAAGKTCLAGEIAEKSGARLLAEQFDPARLEAFYRDPSSHALQIELEFLERRAAQLAMGQPEWRRKDRPTVSDFWFGQSLAFATVWLKGGQQVPAYMARWVELQTVVVQPRLTVLLRAPLEALLARIQARSRPGEELLTIDQLRQIEIALDVEAALAEGPVLRLDALDQKAAVTELAAAVEAMR
jgi:2-amino-4-hydroxy-6-hydroxymethyldihydropteridine diphosphokinase